MPNDLSEKKRLRRIDAGLILAVCLPLLAWGGWKLYSYERASLVVWSCGGNYEFLKEYIHDFEKTEGCRVRYTTAPVQYLLEEAAYGTRQPDVIVGRAGPGWVALKRAGKLAEGPVFFALDPFGIAVAKNNPRGIKSINDLGGKGMRVVQSPAAMRPKGKVPALLMAQIDKKFFPGLAERWENNSSVKPKCGRKLLQPIIDGLADCTLTQRSILFYPDVRGRLDFVSIPAKMLLGLKKGRASIPQCAGVLRISQDRGHAEVAHRFVRELGQSTKLLNRFGYLALDDPRAAGLKDLLKVSCPKDMPGWQVKLAKRLEEYGVWREARRRYLKIFYSFGPNHYTARVLCRTGVLSIRLGAPEAARFDLKRVVNEYPVPTPNEYDSRVLTCGGSIPGVERKPYADWILAARKQLGGLPRRTDAHARGLRIRRDPRVNTLFPVVVTDGDPPKNGKRELGLGLHLLVAGDYEFATRDLLKVCTLNYPSRWMPDAEYLLGVCARERGLADVAREQWQRVIRTWPDTRAAAAAELAEADLPHVDAPEAESVEKNVPVMPTRAEQYDTHVKRAFVYASRLYRHRLPLFTFKECAKIISGVYGKTTLGERAEARFRAGVAASALGNARAAAWEWRLCTARYPKTPWADKAAKGLLKLPQETRDSGVPGLPPVPPPAKGSPEVRFRVAEEFRQAGIYNEDEIILEYLKVLTVARPPQGKGGRRLAAAEFHLGAALDRTGRRRWAMEQWRHCAATFAETPWGKKARAAVSGSGVSVSALGNRQKPKKD